MAANDSDPRIVHLKNLRGANQPGGNDNYEIRIPTFQRGIVWNVDQKKKLIESIKLGYPVGSLMAYQTFEANGSVSKPIWSLIDGLQRTSTIIEYLEKPFKVADPSLFYTTEHLSQIAEILFPEDPVQNIGTLAETLNEWLDSIEKNDPATGFHANKLQQFLVHKLFNDVNLSAEKSTQLLDYLPEVFFAHINEEISKIEDASLPMIVYTGPIEQVPDIFERINTQGMKLSKYETFAASWTFAQVFISNQSVIEKIRKKYEALINEGYVISGYSEESREFSEFNLFEYLFGLGKLLSERHPLLFRASQNPSDPVPIAFVIATIAYGLPISQMRDLPKKLNSYFNNQIVDLINFENALMDSCKLVEDTLASFLKINLNTTSRDKQFIPHSDNQILSYITRVLLEKYDFKKNWKFHENSRVDELLKNIKNFYILDILNGEWSGSGDSRLYRVNWNNENSNLVLANDYLLKPSLENWYTTLDAWHGRELAKTHKERTTNSTEAKLLLKFLYQDIITVSVNETIWFHIEHLWSVDKLKSLIQSTNSDGWPIGAFSNLALLKKEINLAKGTQMLGDFEKSDNSNDLDDDDWKQIHKLVVWPSISELTFDKTLDKEGYIQFCRDRFAHLRKIILKEAGFSSAEIEGYLRALSESSASFNS